MVGGLRRSFLNSSSSCFLSLLYSLFFSFYLLEHTHNCSVIIRRTRTRNMEEMGPSLFLNRKFIPSSVCVRFVVECCVCVCVCVMYHVISICHSCCLFIPILPVCLLHSVCRRPICSLHFRRTRNGEIRKHDLQIKRKQTWMGFYRFSASDPVSEPVNFCPLSKFGLDVFGVD